MPVDWETTDEKSASKTVDQLLRQVDDIRATLTTMDRHIRAPKLTAKLGEIAQDIYGNNMYPQQDKLSSLPAELQHMVWSYLTYPADRIVLALTCKMHASIFEELQDVSVIPKSTKKSAKANAKPSTNSKKRAAPRKAITKSDRVHVLNRLQDWMPNQYRLCYDCARYRLKASRSRGGLAVVDKSSWSGRQVEPFKNTDEKTTTKDLKEALITGHKCPDCRGRERLACVAHKANFKQLKKYLGEMTVK